MKTRLTAWRVTRRLAHEMCAVFGGKMPHQVGIVVGGCTEIPTADKVAAFLSMLAELQRFIDEVYVPDVLTIAEAYGDYFAIGGGPRQGQDIGDIDIVNKAAHRLQPPRQRLGPRLARHV